TRTVSAGALTEIRIERNRIYDMGLNGIGVVAFFDLEKAGEVVEVDRLTILGNHIRGCLRREIEAIPAAMIDRIGYGGIALAAVNVESDRPALRVHDNIVTAPLGPALQARITGPVSVVANQLVSQGVTQPARHSTLAVFLGAYPAGSVMILNLGRTAEFNEFQ